MMPIVQFRNVTLGYGRITVVSNVSFDIYAGEFFGLVGPNGAGKTTILRAILGALEPLAGEVTTQSATRQSLCFGYVPQRDTIVDILPYTVEEVVMMGRYRRIGLLRRPRATDREIALESLAHTDIEGLRKNYFNDLSGGQKQRVLIARALAMQPDVLILDEPTNGMDLSSRAAILSLIARLHRVDRLTVIMVSHLLDDVADHVQRLALVERDLFQVDTVDKILTGENLSTLYQRPVSVERLHGKTIILAGKSHGGV
jgi:ABC-type Mn2+/Zn2+ transport system ATPase subunit